MSLIYQHINGLNWLYSSTFTLNRKPCPYRPLQILGDSSLIVPNQFYLLNFSLIDFVKISKQLQDILEFD